MEEIETTAFEIPGSGGEPLRSDLRLPKGADNLPLLIFAHGFKGFKDWGFFPYLCEELARAGFYVLSFNFSHNGVGENMLEFDELDMFEKNTFSIEARELEAVYRAVEDGELPLAVYKPATVKKPGVVGLTEGIGFKPYIASENLGIPVIGASGD